MIGDAGTGKAALVTGGGRGIGRAIALRLAAEGMKVALTARSQNQIDAVVAEIKAAGGEALAVAGDVTSPDDVASVVSAAGAAFGPITVLVNNAGIAGPMGPVGTVAPAAWWQTQQVHVYGAMLMMSEVVPLMAAVGGGRIINTCSRAGTFIAPNYSSYAVAKCALIRLTEHVAAERRAENIFAFPIQPGTILTNIATGTLTSEDAKRWAAPLVALLKTLTPEASAAAETKMQDFVADLARGRWDSLSGQYLDVDWDIDELARRGGPT